MTVTVLLIRAAAAGVDCAAGMWAEELPPVVDGRPWVSSETEASYETIPTGRVGCVAQPLLLCLLCATQKLNVRDASQEEIHGLVRDGVTFSRARLQGRSHTPPGTTAAAAPAGYRAAPSTIDRQPRGAEQARAGKLEKKAKREKTRKPEKQENSSASAPPEAPATAVVSETRAASVAAGGGGRWVHLPN